MTLANLKNLSPVNPTVLAAAPVPALLAPAPGGGAPPGL